jgi:uncharacterized membrane protein YeaQ/YmgE (transglycosylase-associated protein family)
VLLGIILLAGLGLIVGGLARLALPGPDPMGLLATIGLGLLGSFVGGLIALVLGFRASLLGGIVGAIAVLYLYRRFVQHRPLTGPGAHELPPRR